MLRVTIELVPWGMESQKRTLATADIINDGSGTKSSGNYNFRLDDKAGRVWKSGRVEGFPRKRLLAFDLLFRALNNVIGERNGD